MRKCLLIAISLLLVFPFGASAHDRQEVRSAWQSIRRMDAASPYLEQPNVTVPYSAGALLMDARIEALDYLNFARWLAGLAPVSDSSIYDYQCQRGAVLLAALDYVDHDAPIASGMEKNFYDSAHIATSSGCIARFNWMRESILREGVEYFLRDDGEANLDTLGHRRWALNPNMASTGFGLANSASGMSYVVMYAHDMGRSDTQWDRVCWPAEGAFPAEFIHDHLAWCVILNPEKYDISALAPTITHTEENSGLSFRFVPSTGAGDGFSAINLEGYGAGPCLVFRPDFTDTGFTDYLQNQKWRVRIDGLKKSDGSYASLDYTVDMISLTPQDAVNVEIAPVEAVIAAGESIRLKADVIPEYADDLSVIWESTDPHIATVDDAGYVTALNPGECDIIVRCSGNFEDTCRLTVQGTAGEG